MKTRIAVLIATLLATAALQAQSDVTLHPSKGKTNTKVNVTLEGIGSDTSGVTLQFTPGGLTPSNLHSKGDHLGFTLDVASSAQPGWYTLILTRTPPAGAMRSLPSIVVNNAFFVEKSESVTMVLTPVGINATLEPNHAPRGTQLDVEAKGLLATDQYTFTFTPGGLTANNVRLIDRRVFFTLTIASNAAPGPYTLILKGGEVATATQTFPNAFTVDTPPTTPTAPSPGRTVVPSVRVLSVSPTKIPIGATSIITIQGTGFQKGVKVSLPGGGVDEDVKTRTDTSIVANITVAATTKPGMRRIVVRNQDNSSNDNQSPPVMIELVAPAVEPPKPPVVTAIAPQSANPGQTLLVKITGTGFKAGASVDLGTGVGATLVSANDTQIVANVAIGPAAPAGQHRVRIQNPDGASNDAQPQPVYLTINPVSATTPVVPPTTIPPATVPPTTVPPTTVPPTTVPPATVPPTTPPATVPPATIPPAVVPPVTTPPVVTPTPKPPVTPGKPPGVQGPRVDIIKPASLEMGSNYTLELEGKNFSVNTKISLGNDVTIVGVPTILSPTKAKLSVLVSPAAKPGVVAAVASNDLGTNTGPGGVMLASKAPPQKKSQKPPEAVIPPTLEEMPDPTGELKLLAPCDPLDGYDCEGVPMLVGSIQFSWAEVTPGIADFYVLEILTGDGKILYTAQTKNKYLDWSMLHLAALHNKRVELGVGKAGASKGKQGAKPAKKKSSSGGPLTPLTALATYADMFPDAVFWRVKGMRQKTSKPPYMAELSFPRPITVPEMPTGLACPAQQTLSFQPVEPKTPFGPPCEPPAPGSKKAFSNVICSGMQAKFHPDSFVDLSTNPFLVKQNGTMGFGGNSQVSFNNVFIDWGDGSEPKPLKAVGPKSSFEKAYLDPAAYLHKYTNPDTSSDAVDYLVRVYSLSDELPTSLMAIAGAAAKTSGAGADSHKKTVSTLACGTVKVFNEQDATKDGPLVLVAATTIFPEDWSKLTGAYKLTGGKDGETLAAEDIPINTTGLAGGQPHKKNSAPPKNLGPEFDESKIAQISECAEAFRPFVRLRYYGHGRARIRWILDGKVIEERETHELPPVTETDAMNLKKSVDLDLTVPLPTHIGTHKLQVHIETGTPLKAQGKGKGEASGKNTSGQTSGSGILGATGKGFDNSTSGWTNKNSWDPAASNGNPSTQKKSDKNTDLGFNPNGVGLYDPGAGNSLEGPFNEVDAAQRIFKVVPQLPGVPCRLLYKTAETGTFVITDITDFKLLQNGSSGKGQLHLPFPTGIGAIQKEFVDVTFTNWKLEPSPSDPTEFAVLNGSLNQKAVVAGEANGFPLDIHFVSLTPQALKLNGAVGLPKLHFKKYDGTPARFAFTQQPLTAQGLFTLKVTEPITVQLLGSQYNLDVTEADFSFGKNLPAPPTACAKTGFRGALVKGTLRAPANVNFGSQSVLADQKVGPWAITASGLSAKESGDGFLKDVKEGTVNIDVSKYAFNTCDGGIQSSFDVTFTGLALVPKPIQASTRLTQYGMEITTEEVSTKKSWGNADVDMTLLSMNKEDGKWFFSANGDFAFRAYGQDFIKVEYDGMKAYLAGGLNLPGKTVSKIQNSTANLAGFPMVIKQFSGTPGGSSIAFIFTGDIDFAKNIQTAKDREVKFALPYQSASLSMPSEMELASGIYGDGDPFVLLAAPPESNGGAEPTVQNVKFDLGFPTPESSLVRIAAECQWSSSPTGYRFTADDGVISVLNSVNIDKTRFVFGNDKGTSYWLAQARAQLPAPVQLGATPLYLFHVGGGLGHNVDIKSFAEPDLSKIVASGGGNYLFSGQVNIGTLDQTAFYSDGVLTVEVGNGFGARADIKAWLLTSDHGGTPTGQGCVQYQGGTFTAGFKAHYEALGGQLVVDAPGGPDPCKESSVHIYFHTASDWHIHLGRPDARVSASVLGVKAGGSLQIDAQKTNFDFVVHKSDKVSLDVGLCTAHAGWEFYWGLGAGFQYSPSFALSASAAAGVGVSAGCGSFDVGAGGDVTLSVTLPGSSAICGSLGVYVKVWGDKYYLINTGNFCL